MPSTRGEKQTPPPRPPPPPARLKSPERPKFPVSKKPQLSPPQKRPDGNQVPPVVGGKVSCAGDNNGGPVKPQPPAKPQVHRKPSNVSDKSLNLIDNPVHSGSQLKDQAAVADLYSKVNKAGKNNVDLPKKMSLDQENANIHRREAVRKNSGERRKTVLSVDFEKEDVSGSERVSVAMRTKLFDGQIASKPVPPKKSEAVRSLSMRTSREKMQISPKAVLDSTNGSEEIYDPPWDSTKNSAVEKLRQSQQPSMSAANSPPNLTKQSMAGKPSPPPLPSQPPPKTTRGLKPSSSNSPPKPPHAVSVNQDPPAKSAILPPNACPPKPPHAVSVNQDPPAKSAILPPNACPPKPPHAVSANKDPPAKSAILPPNACPSKPPHAVSVNQDPPAKSAILSPNPCPPKPPHAVSANKDPPAKSHPPVLPPNSCPPKPPHVVSTNKDPLVKSLSAAPPPKPPRTHAHDTYLISKVTKEPESRDQQTSKKTVEAPSDEAEQLSVKDRLAKLMQLQTPEASGSGSGSNSSTLSSKEQDIAMRQKPPSRPPPPKHRPNSGESNASSSPGATPARPLTHCPDTEHSHGGPIIIPVFPRGHLQKQQQQLQQHQLHPHMAYHRQNSATHDSRRRNPTDDLPQEPNGLRPLQRFPLRKSFSSECVHSSRGSSLNLSTAATWGDSSAGTGDNCPDMSRSAHAYEAVIDPDGYAVPNEFLLLPKQRKSLQADDQMVSSQYTCIWLPCFLHSIFFLL